MFLLMIATVTAGCRDEQAGPRPPPKPASNRGRVPRAPSPSAVLDHPPSELSWRSSAVFGGALRYLGSRVTPERPEPGADAVVSHFFEVLGAIPPDHELFVHAVDPASGQMRQNLDHPFAGGAASLDALPIGKVVVDTHRVPIPADGSPFRLMLGFYRGEERLTVQPAEAEDGQRRAVGPLIATRREELPTYRAVYVSEPPRIDGRLDDAAWTAAKELTLVGSFDGRRPRVRTTARLVWDDAALYVAFDCEDPDVWGTLLERDAPIYEQEVVEVFLDADADLRTYNELEVSPNDVVFDAYFPAYREGMDRAWDSGVTTAVRVRGTLNAPDDRDQGWAAELRIPFARLAKVPNVPPKPTDRWRFNLYRLEHHGRQQIEGQAFSPLGVGDFHHLRRFGWLEFDR